MKIINKKILALLIIMLFSLSFVTMMEVYAEGEEVIDVARAYVAVPVIGEAPSIDVTPGDSSKYWIDDNETSWYRISPTSGPFDTFLGGRIYSFRILFRPKPGYTFSDDTLFLINDAKTGYWGDSKAMAQQYFYTVDEGTNVTITFKYKNEQEEYVVFSQETVKYNEMVGRPTTNPTKEGYTFVKWETANGYDVDFNSHVTTSTDYFAVFIENANLQHYTITLNPNNDTLETDTIDNVVGGSINSLETVENYGFTVPNGKQFYGWKVGEKIYLPGEYFKVTSDITATAQYIGSTTLPTTHTITFKDGTATLGTDVVNDNATLTVPANPEKQGYVFVNWYADEGLETLFDFSTPITSDTTIYARWNEKIEDISVTITLPVAGQNPVETGESGDSSKYTIKSVAFYDDESNLLSSSDTFVAGETYTIYVTYSPKVGYTFPSDVSATINDEAATFWTTISDQYQSKAFYIDYTVPVLPTVVTEASATVVAPVAGEHPSFTATPGDSDAYTATVYAWYDLDNNGASMTASDTFVEGNEYQVRIHFVANDGYEFSASPSYVINGTPNFTAYEMSNQRGMNFTVSSSQVTTHTVTFNLDGGTMSGENSVVVNHGEKVARPANDPYKADMYFVDWYADSTKTTKFNFETTEINEDTVIYAKFKSYASLAIGTTPGGKYSVPEVFAENMNESMNATVPQDGIVTLTAVADSGYHFVGWYEGVIGNSYFVEDHTNTLISSNATYTVTIENALIIRAVFAEDEVNNGDLNSPTYTIIEGGNQTYYKGSNTNIVIKASGPVDKLQGMEIDNGNPINPSDYDIESGSTILTLKSSFLENSSLGEHTITFKYDDGEVETKITIAEATDNDDPTTNPDENENNNDNQTTNPKENNAGTNSNGGSNPKTSDDVMTYVYVFVISFIGLISGIIFLKRKGLINK